jgi:hypothetical protein
MASTPGQAENLHHRLDGLQTGYPVQRIRHPFESIRDPSERIFPSEDSDAERPLRRRFRRRRRLLVGRREKNSQSTRSEFFFVLF